MLGQVFSHGGHKFHRPAFSQVEHQSGYHQLLITATIEITTEKIMRSGGGSIGTIEVQGDEAIFTSGNYERFRLDQTERYPHILDPTTGWPATDIASVTVITAKGLLADAAATALVVAGLDAWPEVAAALELKQVAVVDEAGTVYLTTEMQQRIQFSDDVQTVIIE